MDTFKNRYIAAFVCLMAGLALGLSFDKVRSMLHPHGFCDVAQRIDGASAYPIEIDKKDFVASVDDEGVLAISFPPCGRVFPISAMTGTNFKAFEIKSLNKRNTIFVMGKTTGNIIFLRSIKAPAYRPSAFKALRETSMPGRL